MHQREHIVTLELLASLKKVELHHEAKSGHLSAIALDKLGCSESSAAGGQQVVDDQNAAAVGDGAGVHLERVGPVLEA